MPTDACRIGTLAWSKRTNGQLSSVERRRLPAPLARAHLHNLVGRTAMALHVNSGRRAAPPCRPSAVPSSALTRAAEEQAQQRLSPALLAHSCRCYRFGIALAAAVAAHPRAGFPREFRTAWAAEAAAVPQGRARFLRRYGALDLAVRLAPHEE